MCDIGDGDLDIGVVIVVDFGGYGVVMVVCV